MGEKGLPKRFTLGRNALGSPLFGSRLPQESQGRRPALPDLQSNPNTAPIQYLSLRIPSLLKCRQCADIPRTQCRNRPRCIQNAGRVTQDQTVSAASSFDQGQAGAFQKPRIRTPREEALIDIRPPPCLTSPQQPGFREIHPLNVKSAAFTDIPRRLAIGLWL